MTTAALERITSVPITYEIDATALTSKVQSYQGLTIAGVDDREGYKAVSEARKDLKRVRVSIENRRKELKADALAYGKRVDDAAKALTALIEPTEQRLLAEEERIDTEKERIKREAEEARQRKLQDRVNALGPTGTAISLPDLQAMSDEAFEVFLAARQEEHAKETARLAAEAAARKAEEDRVAAEQAEQRRIEAERLAEEAARLKREREEAEAQLAEQRAAIRREREAQEAEARRLAEERAKLEAERKAKADAEAAEQRRIEAEKQAAEEAARREALRPDREKLLTVVDAIRAIDVPEVSLDAAETAEEVLFGLQRAAEIIQELIDRRLPC